MRKVLGRNRHQRAAHRPGEQRVGRDEIAGLLEQSRSDDPVARAEAARLLCPCHIRRRISEVWHALYRLLEDPDPLVRRAAWHTLEDGGRPGDPALDAIVERALRQETDSQVLRFARQLAGPRDERRKLLDQLPARPLRDQRGRCDFCGADDVPVTRDLGTLIPGTNVDRPARICGECDSGNGEVGQ